MCKKSHACLACLWTHCFWTMPYCSTSSPLNIVFRDSTTSGNALKAPDSQTRFSGNPITEQRLKAAILKFKQTARPPQCKQMPMRSKSVIHQAIWSLTQTKHIHFVSRCDIYCTHCKASYVLITLLPKECLVKILPVIVYHLSCLNETVKIFLQISVECNFECSYRRNWVKTLEWLSKALRTPNWFLVSSYMAVWFCLRALVLPKKYIFAHDLLAYKMNRQHLLAIFTLLLRITDCFTADLLWNKIMSDNRLQMPLSLLGLGILVLEDRKRWRSRLSEENYI